MAWTALDALTFRKGGRHDAATMNYPAQFAQCALARGEVHGDPHAFSKNGGMANEHSEVSDCARTNRLGGRLLPSHERSSVLALRPGRRVLWPRLRLWA